MAETLKIQIPKPCHENWNTMTLNQQGRFCGSCAKSVVDFTKMKTPEIQQYFIQNQGKKICGRFNNDQLYSIRISIPAGVFYSQTQFHKIFLLALLLSMGTTLISCSDNYGGKKNIESVEIIDEENEFYTTTMGASLIVDSSMIKAAPFKQVKPPPKPCVAPVSIKGEVLAVPIQQKPEEENNIESMSKIHIDTIQ